MCRTASPGAPSSNSRTRRAGRVSARRAAANLGPPPPPDPASARAARAAFRDGDVGGALTHAGGLRGLRVHFPGGAQADWSVGVRSGEPERDVLPDGTIVEAWSTDAGPEVPPLRLAPLLVELVRERDAARAHAEALRAALEASGDGARALWLLDPSGQVEWANAVALAVSPPAHGPRPASSPDRVADLPGGRTLVSRHDLGALVTHRLQRLEGAWELTPAQTRCLRLVVSGLTNAEIAAGLSVREGTVEAHVAALLRKSRTSNRAELVTSFWTYAPRSA